MIFLSILSNIKRFKYLYIIAIYAFTIFLFVLYYYYSQSKIAELEPYKKQYNQTIEKYNTDIKFLKDSYNKQLETERSSFNSYKKQCGALQKLDKATKKAPTKVEKLINKASKNRIDCFAAATGNKDKVNELCKDYYKN